MKKRSIKILGGGISGLTAAIVLGKAGYDVEVYENKKYCGKATNDFQFLANWFANKDILDYLKNKIGIKLDFYVNPRNFIEFYGPSLKKYTGRGREPIMYLVKRGKNKDSIDSSLKRQAKELGVKIRYNSTIPKSKADIVAIGVGKPSALTMGVKFKLKHPSKEVVILDNDLFGGWYGYLVSHKGVGEIVSCTPPGINDAEERLNNTIRIFEKLLNFKVCRISSRFSAIAVMDYVNRGFNGKQYIVGEAAGFQDAFAGFGMYYAFTSGYLAAQSIITGKDYDKMWKKDFLNKLKVSHRNRRLYGCLSNNLLNDLIDDLSKKKSFLKRVMHSSDFRIILRKAYDNGLKYFLSNLFTLKLKK